MKPTGHTCGILDHYPERSSKCDLLFHSNKEGEAMEIFRVVPMDRKGEQDGNSFVTLDKNVAIRAKADGHAVHVTEAVEWRVAWEKPWWRVAWEKP